MTKAYSTMSDNGGRCERCNSQDSIRRKQTTYELKMGGGLGWGTMWVCDICLPLMLKRDKIRAKIKEANKLNEDVSQFEIELKEIEKELDKVS